MRAWMAPRRSSSSFVLRACALCSLAARSLFDARRTASASSPLFLDVTAPFSSSRVMDSLAAALLLSSFTAAASLARSRDAVAAADRERLSPAVSLRTSLSLILC